MSLYVANDDDWEYDQYGNPIAAGGLEEEEGEEEGDGDWDDGAEDDMLGEWEGTGKTVVKAVPLNKERLHSDVPDEAFWDDSSLVRCWAAALVDFKYHHPSKFAPLVEAPRTPKQKCLAAPLWFGRFEESNKAARVYAPAETHKASTKRKKKEKTKDAKRVKFDTAVDTPSSPKWAPQSPGYQRALSPALSEPPALSLAETSTSSPSVALNPVVAEPVLPSPKSFVPSIPPLPTSITARLYPAPPSIVPVDPTDAPDAGTETPEELLQNALWSWYNAGYQTALYHASMGVAGVSNE
ncbi:hypothetical protein P7C70_g8218, partial [Phenoliferia sp. Uapishka_3]